MEFDTGMKLRPSGSVRVASSKEPEDFYKEVGEIAAADAKAVGDSGAGEMWLDYSNPLQTRHIVLNVSRTDGGYEIGFRAGKRPGRIMDVLLMAFALLLIWCLGKCLTPAPQAVYIAGLVVAVIGVAATLALAYGKTFGREETARLREKLGASGEKI